MKLAFLCNNMKSTNGIERVLAQRLSLLAESGMYEVYLITYNQYGAPFSFPISEKVHYIDLSTRYISHCSYHGVLQYLDRFISKHVYKWVIHKCLKRVAPDVITCMDIYLADLQTVLNCKIDAVKVVECHCGLSAYFGDLAKIKSKCKYSKEQKNKEKIVQTIREFDKIIVMTEDERKDWMADDQAVCISNMLPCYPSQLSGKGYVHHRVISVGRYAYQKGYDMLLKSWEYVQERHPGWSLDIYGSRDGDRGDYDLLKKIIDNGAVKNVFLHAATNDIYSKYCESDIYVMSSRFESFGLVMIEAMSCGLPVLAFNCKYGPGSIIKDGDTGILIPQNDVGKLAETLCFMIENAEMRHQMGENARVASKKYLPETIMSQWYDFYKSLEKVNSTSA